MRSESHATFTSKSIYMYSVKNKTDEKYQSAREISINFYLYLFSFINFAKLQVNDSLIIAREDTNDVLKYTGMHVKENQHIYEVELITVLNCSWCVC